MGTDATALPHDDGLDWDELYGFYAPALRRFIGEHAPAADIEDILQKTFVRLVHLRAQGRLDASKPLWPLLFTLARRAGIDHWRTRPRETVFLHAPDGRHAVEVPGEEMEAIESITDAFASLRRREQRLLLRCIIEGAPQDEVAAEEGLSKGALKVALGRARKRFRSAYLAALVEEGAPGVWAVALRLRARVHRAVSTGERGAEEVVRLGAALTAAAAVFTLAASAVGPPSAQAVNPIEVVAGRNATGVLAWLSGPVGMREQGSAGSQPRGNSSTSSPAREGPTTPPASPGVRVTRADGTVVARPDNPYIGISLEWSDPWATNHAAAGVEFNCSGSLVGGATCPVARQLPGTGPRPEE